MFSNHFQRNNTHDRIHQNLRRTNITAYHRDRSCEHCYPPDLILSENFNTFWNWFSSEFPANTYTRYTQQYLEELAYVEGDDIWLTLIDLIFSIRYAYTPTLDFEALQQELWNVYNITQGFRLDPYFEAYQYSKTLYITPQDSKESSEGSLPVEPEFDIYTEDLNLQLLFQQPVNIAQPNQQDFTNLQNAITALTQALRNTNQALTNNTNAVNNPPRREGRVAELPYFYGGNQDPVA